MDEKSNIKNNLSKAILLGSFSFGIMAFVLPIYSKRIGGNAVTIGGLFSIFSAVTLILRPIVGKALDRYGRKKFFVTAFLFYAAAMLTYSYAVNLALIYISRLIQAIGASFMWISAYSIAVDIAADEERGKSVGGVDGASSKGALYGTVIGFIVLSQFSLVKGWSLLFKGYAILSVLGGFLAYKYIPETSKVNKNMRVKEKEKLSKDFLKLLCIIFMSSISASMISPLIMIYLQDKFTTDVGVLAAAYVPAALVYAYLPSKLGGVSDRIGRIKPMIIGLIISGVVSLGIVGSSDIKILVALWAVESIGIVMASPAEEALVADLTGSSTRGSAYGVYLFTSSLGAVIGPILGGWLYDSLGHNIPFYINAAVLLLDAALAAVLFRNYKVRYKDMDKAD